jgi:hypothetical protein
MNLWSRSFIFRNLAWFHHTYLNNFRPNSKVNFIFLIQFNKKFKDSGTDSNISVKLVGTDKTVVFELKEKDAISTNKELFEKGNLDRFRVSGDKIGKLKKIALAHDGAGMSDQWKIEYIKIFIDKETYTLTK